MSPELVVKILTDGTLFFPLGRGKGITRIVNQHLAYPLLAFLVIGTGMSSVQTLSCHIDDSGKRSHQPFARLVADKGRLVGSFPHPEPENTSYVELRPGSPTKL